MQFKAVIILIPTFKSDIMIHNVESMKFLLKTDTTKFCLKERVFFAI